MFFILFFTIFISCSNESLKTSNLYNSLSAPVSSPLGLSEAEKAALAAQAGNDAETDASSVAAARKAASPAYHANIRRHGAAI